MSVSVGAPGQRSRWVLVCALVAVGCHEGGGEVPDGGPDAEADASVGQPAEPEPPAPPDPTVLTPCPDGWREVAGPPDAPWQLILSNYQTW